MKQFWDDRYSEESYAYGDTPNEFFKEQLTKLSTGRLLLPAEGEGRNAVFAAKQGWNVIAFDQSESGKKKALKLAAKNHVSINYDIHDLLHLDYALESFDAIALIYVHMPPSIRMQVHQGLCKLLKSGGKLILEGFSKDHLKYNSVNPKAGGPQNLELLFSYDELKSDFCDMDIQSLEEEITHLQEGLYHVGESAVVRMVATKK
ncbi:MAG: class I SAM-dependent methyltransferase [Flavobacteriales bacterium]|nr:class I SAM-dependent methyltransferase [Flavobacteriales bacterium]MCB9198330.1 class I SAM-dependent methyltransferase [Flavobacteriales bacterium]